MNRFPLTTALAFSAVIGVAATSYADKTIDNFETYKKGEVIGASYNSKPWCRFGTATDDNVVATGTDGWVISGRRSGQYGAFWPNRFGAVRFVFKSTTDLNEFAKSSVKIRSNKPTSNTRVKLAVSNGETTYISSAGQALTNKVQHLTFSLDPSDMVLADGSDSYADVVTNAKMIGLDFTSTEGQYTEAIIFDDFELLSSVAAGGSAETDLGW